MSRIPYVNMLGDELERAARRAQERARPRRRRLALFALAGALLVSGSALATGILSGDPEVQATGSVECYDGADADFTRSVAAVPQQAGSAAASPVELCRRFAGLTGPLVACGRAGTVAVIRGRTPADCVAAGFTRLDPAFRRARLRAARVEQGLLALEAREDCADPRELVHRVRKLLSRAGWRVEVGLQRRGPCGSVSYTGGNGRRYISWDWADDDRRRLYVSRGAPRSVLDVLYSAERSLLGPLFAQSGARCFTFEALSQRIRRMFSAEGLQVAVRRTTIPRGSGLDDEDGRWTRYRQGCAVLVGGAPGRALYSVVIEVFVRA